MKKQELATARARLYKSTYKQIIKLAREQRTTVAHIVAQAMKSNFGV